MVIPTIFIRHPTKHLVWFEGGWHDPESVEALMVAQREYNRMWAKMMENRQAIRL